MLFIRKHRWRISPESKESQSPLEPPKEGWAIQDKSSDTRTEHWSLAFWSLFPIQGDNIETDDLLSFGKLSSVSTQLIFTS